MISTKKVRKKNKKRSAQGRGKNRIGSMYSKMIGTGKISQP